MYASQAVSMKAILGENPKEASRTHEYQVRFPVAAAVTTNYQTSTLVAGSRNSERTMAKPQELSFSACNMTLTLSGTRLERKRQRNLSGMLHSVYNFLVAVIEAI